MKFAIDRYAIGTEKEVSADEFDNKYIVNGLEERFFCPECGERVLFRSSFFRNGVYCESCFYHQKKTDRSPECDKRVDGNSNLTISQRVGLPLFITQISAGNFQLSVGFPALGSKTLDKHRLWYVLFTVFLMAILSIFLTHFLILCKIGTTLLYFYQ